MLTMCRINIPVFSGLYSKITHGAKFTAFEAFSLLIAIPMTVIVKMITGAAPPGLKSLNQDVIGFLFRMNTNTIIQSTGDSSGNMKLLPGAMGNLISGLSLMDEQDKAVQQLWDSIKTEVSQSRSYKDFKEELSYVVRFLPTLVTGATVAIGLVLPVFTVSNMLYNLATGGNQKVAKEFPAGKVGRVIGLTATILGGTMTVLYPHPEMPGVKPRIFGGINSLVFGYYGVIFSYIGDVDMGGDLEDVYQFLYAVYRTLSFVCYCNVWDDESKHLDAPETFPSYGNNPDCVTIGIASSTFTFIADMCGLAAYILFKLGMPEFGVAAYGTQLVEQIDVGALLGLRFAEQYQQEFIINYSTS